MSLGELIFGFVTSSSGQTIAISSSLFAIVLSSLVIYKHLLYYSRPHLQRYLVRVILIVPVYALGSVLSLLYPQGELYFDSIRDCYEAFVIYVFVSLLLAYAGGEAACAAAIDVDPGTMRHPFPLSFLPEITTNSTFVRHCKQALIQFVVIKPLMAGASLGMHAVSKLRSAQYQWTLFIVYNVSYTVALYYLVLFYMATRSLLAQFNVMRQLLAVKSIVFMTYWQSLLIFALPLWTSAQAAHVNSWLLAIEMLGFAIAHALAFSAAPYGALDGRRLGVLRAARHVLSLRDLMHDTINTFSGKVASYALLSTFDIDAAEHMPPGAVSAAAEPMAPSRHDAAEELFGDSMLNSTGDLVLVEHTPDADDECVLE
eukprot:Amastigsp_a676188_206.p2 type:complete len:371 gc:universal Amastigsp_a676188_206:102-1214(+)